MGNSLKIVVFTYDRFDSATTPNIIEKSGLDYLVVCHTEEARQKYLKHGTVASPDRIVSSNVSMGLANNRNWYLDNYVKQDEWCLMLVDDLLSITELNEYDKYLGANYTLPVTFKSTNKWRAELSKEISFDVFHERCKEAIEIAEKQNCLLIGFAGNDNPLFRKTKWKKNVLADGRAWLVKKSHLKFDVKAQMIDDVCFSAQNIENLTGVLVNQWILPECKRYTKGAFGSIQDRMERRKKECMYLCKRFYGLVKFANKAGWPAGSHIRITPMNRDKLINFRMKQVARGVIT